jgi:hypothetical protein
MPGCSLWEGDAVGEDGEGTIAKGRAKYLHLDRCCQPEPRFQQADVVTKDRSLALAIRHRLSDFSATFFPVFMVGQANSSSKGVIDASLYKVEISTLPPEATPAVLSQLMYILQ